MPTMEYFFQRARKLCHAADLNVRLRALETLEHDYAEQVEADFLMTLLHEASSSEEQQAILDVASSMGARAPIPELVAMLVDREEYEWMVRRAVAVTLAALGEHAPVEVFIRLLADATEDRNLRETMAGLLGTFGERVPVEVLVAAVADPDPDLCAAAIESLAAQGQRAPLSPILARVAHPEGYVRKAAIRALGSMRERAPLEPIVAALGDGDPQVREAAACAMDLLLEWFGTRVPLAPLVAATRDDDPRVRESALDALALHPEYAPIEPVVAALSDQHAYVRCAALLVLERMGGEHVPEDVRARLQEMTQADPHPSVRASATRTLLVLSGMEPGEDQIPIIG